MTTTTSRILKTVVFLGSARENRLGNRVLQYVSNALYARQHQLGDLLISHDYSVVDPIQVFGKDGALAAISAGELRVPTFFAAELPPETQALKDLITQRRLLLDHFPRIQSSHSTSFGKCHGAL
jgi:hypothetical protein